MKTVSYTEIENATASDIGKIALLASPFGPTLAIEELLSECLEVCARLDLGEINADEIRTGDDANSETPVAWIVGE